MLTFIFSLIILVIGYMLYGRLCEHIFMPSDKKTPAISVNDGVDYVPLKTWRVFLIQLLNIAGTGPIFGALMGAVFGPIVFLWVVGGSILAGAVHDYFTGMISVRMNGASISEIVGKYLGTGMKQIMRVFSVVLLILVGTVFVTSPATLLANLTPAFFSVNFWTIVILLYYLLATLLPIDKLIARIYPIFGVVLLVMALGIICGIVFGGYSIPELALKNLHPSAKPVFPFMFITVACGAISGFHATQSPLMARCLSREKDGRKVFYGAMITEGVIALIWAAAGVAFYHTTGGLENALNRLGQSGVVYDISTSLLGITGGILAVIGVVICPVTSGDTAFRSARLTVSDWFGIKQNDIVKRLGITVPLLIVGGLLTQINFNIIWRYFSWSNQTLAMIALWAIAVYLRNKLGWFVSMIAFIPATFMSAVTSTYILMADEGFRLPYTTAYVIGAVFTIVVALIFLINNKVLKSNR